MGGQKEVLPTTTVAIYLLYHLIIIEKGFILNEISHTQVFIMIREILISQMILNSNFMIFFSLSAVSQTWLICYFRLYGSTQARFSKGMFPFKCLLKSVISSRCWVGLELHNDQLPWRVLNRRPCDWQSGDLTTRPRHLFPFPFKCLLKSVISSRCRVRLELHNDQLPWRVSNHGPCDRQSGSLTTRPRHLFPVPFKCLLKSVISSRCRVGLGITQWPAASAGLEPRTFWSTVRRLNHSTTTPLSLSL